MGAPSTNAINAPHIIASGIHRTALWLCIDINGLNSLKKIFKFNPRYSKIDLIVRDSIAWEKFIKNNKFIQ